MRARQTLLLAIVVSLVLASTGCGSKKQTASPAKAQASPTCQHVNALVAASIAKGLNSGKKLVGGMWGASTGASKAPWALSSRIQGVSGVAVWVTDLTPTTKRVPQGSFIQAANRVAWDNSQWGVIGTFPKNYGTGPGFPALDNAGINKAATCA